MRRSALFFQVMGVSASALARRYAGIITGVNRPRAGGWNSRNPGVLVWHTPNGRTYATTPTEYAV